MSFLQPNAASCPICDYDRAAIPESPRCPECGYPFQETLRIRRTRPIPIWVVALAAILATMFLEGTLAPALRRAKFLPARDAQMAAALLGVIGPALLGTCPIGAVGIGHLGVALQSPFCRRRWIPYADIDVRHRARGIYALHEKSGGPLRLPIAGMSWKKRVSIEAEIARAWAQADRPSPPADTTGPIRSA